MNDTELCDASQRKKVKVPPQTSAKRPRLPPRKQKRPRSVHDDSEGSLTDPGEHQVEVKVERDDGNYILVSDPLTTQNSAEGSFKELYSHSPRDLLHPYEQPPTSTIVPVIKEEIEDEDYKEMFLKLQEEVEALTSNNQRLMIENNNLAREIHNLKDTSDTTQNVKASAVINDSQSVKDNYFLRKLAQENQRLSEKIFEYAEKIRDLNAQYKHVDESIIIVDQNDRDEHEKPETLTDKLRRLTEENKKVISERDNLKDTVQNLLVDLENFSEDNKALKRMVKLQRKTVEKLRIQCGVHSGTIKRLMLSSVKLRSMYSKLKMARRNF